MTILDKTPATTAAEREQLRQLVADQDEVRRQNYSVMPESELAWHLAELDQQIRRCEKTAERSNRAKGRLRELQQGRQRLIESVEDARIELHGIAHKAQVAQERLLAGCPRHLRDEVQRMEELLKAAEKRLQAIPEDAPLRDRTHARWEVREASDMHDAAIRACIDWNPKD